MLGVLSLALAVGAPAPAQASVSYFKKACPVPYKAERVKQLNGVNRKEVIAALNKSQFKIGNKTVTITPKYNWRTGRKSGLTKKTGSLEFLSLLAAAVDNNVSRADVGFPEPKRREAMAKIVSIAASFARASNSGRVVAKDVHKSRIVALRAPIMAYAGRAGACHGVLRQKDAKPMKRALSADLKRLGRKIARSEPANHRLTIAVGRLLVGDYLRHDVRARRLANGARRTFRKQLLRGYNGAEGTWLEHSPEYHRLAYSIIKNFVENIYGGDGMINQAERRLKNTLGWFVLPDNSLVQWGDTTNRKYGLDYVVNSPGREAGWRPARRSGFVTYSDSRGNWYGLTSQYHFRQHKHNDEGSFDLWHQGQRVIQDTGRWGPGKKRNLEKSARSHSSLIVDNDPFDIDLHLKPYGSSVMAASSGAGPWFGSMSRNPLLIAPTKLTRQQRRERAPSSQRRILEQYKKAAKKNVGHTRIAVYSPNKAVVILDRVRSTSKPKRARAYQRFLQLAPGARYEGGTITVGNSRLPVSSRLGNGAVQTPRVVGNAPYFPTKGKQLNRQRLTFTSKGKAVDHIMVIGLDNRVTHGEIVGGRIGLSHTEVVLRDKHDKPVETLTITRSGGSLTVAGR